MNKELRIKNYGKKNHNSYFMLHNSEEGFTLIELLVVMVIVITVGVIVSAIVTSALRGSNKVRAINNLENNGNSVIAQISKTIRFAKKFEGVRATTTGTLNSNCVIPTPGLGTPTPAPSDPTPTPVSYKAVVVTDYNAVKTEFVCDESAGVINSISSPSTTPVPMIEKDSEVTLTSCKFICSQYSASDYPTIGVQFTLSQYAPTGGVSPLPENTASADFQTSITPRNIGR